MITLCLVLTAVVWFGAGLVAGVYYAPKGPVPPAPWPLELAPDAVETPAVVDAGLDERLAQEKAEQARFRELLALEFGVDVRDADAQ